MEKQTLSYSKILYNKMAGELNKGPSYFGIDPELAAILTMIAFCGLLYLSQYVSI